MAPRKKLIGTPMTAPAITPQATRTNGAAIPKPKPAAAVVPIAPKAAGIAFPGGHVSSPAPGCVNIVVDHGTGARQLAGSDHQPFTEALLDRVLAVVRTSTSDPEAAAKRIAAAAAALAAFKPLDEIEGMLAAQCVALHHAAMECLRRAGIEGQHPDAAAKLRKDAANLARAMTDMLAALDSKRGKGPQVVRVERVVVHEGGQAIVGNVAAVPKLGEGG